MRYVAVHRATQEMQTPLAYRSENLCLLATKINACRLLVVRTVNVILNRIRPFARVWPAILVVRHFVALNVSVYPIVRCKKRASIRNVLIHVPALVATTLNVEL